jgi:drug/metabolite transporter (DMT)-like permease
MIDKVRHRVNISDEVLGAILAIISIFLFSAKAILVKIGYRYDIDPISLLLLRMVFSMPFYLAITWIGLKNPKARSIRRNDYLSVIFLGFIGYYLASYFDFLGLKYITASLERLILFIYPTFVILISAGVLKKKISRNQWLAIVITYFGIIVIFIPDIGKPGNNQVWLGSSLIFMSAFMFAIYIIGSEKIIPKLGSVLFTAMAMSVSCFCVISHYLISTSQGLLGFPTEVYIIGLSMAIFCTVLPSFLMSEAIRKIGSSNFAIIGSLGPVSTIILAVIFIQEILTIYQIIGTLIVIMGISVLKRKNSDPASTDIEINVVKS